MKMSEIKIMESVVEIVKATVSGMDRIPDDLEIKEYIHAVYGALNEVNDKNQD